MLHADAIVLAGFPSGISGIVGIAGALVLGLIVIALGTFAYKSMTGGIEWPEDKEPSEDEATKSHSDDDEWDYY